MTYNVKTIFENDLIEISIDKNNKVFVTNKNSTLGDLCVHVFSYADGTTDVAAPFCEYKPKTQMELGIGGFNIRLKNKY